MITLKADNRQLIKNAKYSYLSSNYASGVVTLSIINDNGFSDNDYILIGEFGSETSEIRQIDGSPSGNSLIISSATGFAHSESTKITILKYNQVKFWQTAASTYNSAENYLGVEDIQPDDVFTKYQDTVNSTGFGWFCFYNSTTAQTTTNSNAIPYADFNEYSVKKILDAFFSLLNNKEMKLITHEDAFRWLNEAYTISLNELNLVNQEYGVPAEYSLSVTSGTAEYALPSDFGKLISIHANADADAIEQIKIEDINTYGYWNSGNTNSGITRYYLRGSYIGFVPTPASSGTYDVYYQKKSATLSSYYDDVNLPNNNYYFLIDFMMYRAAPKILRLNGQEHYKMFRIGIDTMKVTSHKQNNDKSSFEIDHNSMV